jgi:hypothetical protein
LRAGVVDRRSGWVKAEHRQILHVLGKDEAARLQHEYAVAVGLIVVEQVLREYAAEAAAAENDKVEGTGIGSGTFIGTSQSLIEAVARESPQDVTSEIRDLRVWTGCHGVTFLSEKQV